MTMNPFFTICITSYNRANTIGRTLESLRRQSYKDFEVIVVDDGSIDNTSRVVSKYNDLNLQYIYKANGGKYTALNVGIKAAKGFMFVILDSDDWLVDNALYRMKELWNTIPEKTEFSGIMGKAIDVDTGKLHGKEFPCSPFISSYVDFHFISGSKNGGYGDCCECNRTELMRRYLFPEKIKTKFIPEYHIMDQIGAEYKLLCTNEIFRMSEYRNDGMTVNSYIYYRENYRGMLQGVVTRLENVFPKTKEHIPLKEQIKIWDDYWWLKLIIDVDKDGPSVTKVSLMRYYSYIRWIIRFVYCN